MENETQSDRNENDPSKEDWFLQTLVNFANSKTLEVEVTLNVGGYLITGRIIGIDQYFELLGESLSKYFSSDCAEQVKGGFKKHGEHYEEEPNPFPSYIHLKDTKYMAQDRQFLMDKGVLWRGRISEVQGFTLGYLSTVAA